MEPSPLYPAFFSFFLLYDYVQYNKQSFPSFYCTSYFVLRFVSYIPRHGVIRHNTPWVTFTRIPNIVTETTNSKAPYSVYNTNRHVHIRYISFLQLLPRDLGNPSFTSTLYPSPLLSPHLISSVSSPKTTQPQNLKRRHKPYSEGREREEGKRQSPTLYFLFYTFP